MLASNIHTFAIEGLHLSLQCSNVVLSWPCLDDGSETFIVQYRQTLELTTPWQTLESNLHSVSGTNMMYFVHSNIVHYANCGGGSLNAMAGTSKSDSARTFSVFDLGVPLAKKADGTGSVVPLGLYPPGFDLSDFLIFEPSTGDWTSGAGLTRTLNVMGANGLNDGPPSPGPGDGGGDTNSVPPETGFYQVVRVGPHFFGLTNGMVLSGVVYLPMEFGNTNTTASLDTLFLFAPDGGPVPNGFKFPDIPNGITYGMTSRWDTTVVPNGTYTFGVGAYLNDYVYGQYGTSMTAYEDNMVTVQVSNPITWDGYGVGGDAFYVGAKTTYTNGTWRLKIYGPQNNLLATLPSSTTYGPIDGDG